MNNPLAALLASAMHDADEGPAILPEAAIHRLREAAPRFTAPVPFVVGDLVTPRSDSPIKGAGNPHLVIETRPGAEPFFGALSPGSPDFGMRLNVRVITISGGDVCAYWGDAADYEIYTGEAAE